MPHRLRLILLAAVFAGGLTIQTAGTSAGVAAGTLYGSNWSRGLQGWKTSGGGWHGSHGVVSYNGNSASVMVSGYKPANSHYAVQVSIRLLSWRDTGISESHGYGILLRAAGPTDPTGDTAGLMAGVGKGFIGCSGAYSNPVVATADLDFNTLTSTTGNFRVGHGWHLFRAEVNGNIIRVILDGHLRATVKTGQYASRIRVGLFSLSARLQARNFVITQL